ncbi:ABC transporter substrate-binding protein [Mycolicibacterium gilvum]|uniref:ABC-type Fe3+-hydroxamate transport system, periplasmic component n=1 Tax=Mycolicibacterium gilvum (strain DSM 45189 / LMG 24558 / Spyr1) TaxID=278137 RepID=E6TDZ8_MYCSR|nr:ABC transporter substrate-binding protein [Mycolicibacterium gilvum]ADT99842.1 ABC-type Fe3+-hydroxamate transport system, periplasmic component [Mycolicibacterium gilvum Spyr1]
MMPSRRCLSSVAAVMAALVSLTGCAASAPPESGATSAVVSVDNCGEQIRLEAPPQRAVGYFQQSVELMLALGLGESVVATVYPDNPPLPRYAEAYRSIPQLSNKDASFEQVLSAAPDFVYGGYASAFDDTAGRSRRAFHDAGVATYLNPEYCATEPITMDDVHTEIRTIAAIFGVPERADALVEEMRDRVAAAAAAVDGVRTAKIFVYDSGEDTAFTAGRQGIGNQIIELAGGTNIFGDVEDTFADVSWEQVVQRNPDVIVIYDYFGTPSVEDKWAFLQSRPELAGVPAIRDDRYAVLTLQDAVLGVRAPYAVETLARQVHPERFR